MLTCGVEFSKNFAEYKKKGLKEEKDKLMNLFRRREKFFRWASTQPCWAIWTLQDSPRLYLASYPSLTCSEWIMRMMSIENSKWWRRKHSTYPLTLTSCNELVRRLVSKWMMLPSRVKKHICSSYYDSVNIPLKNFNNHQLVLNVSFLPADDDKSLEITWRLAEWRARRGGTRLTLFPGPSN